MINNGGKKRQNGPLKSNGSTYNTVFLSPLSTYAQILITVHWDIGKRTAIQIFVL